MVHIYKLHNAETGETYQGTLQELTDLGFFRDTITKAAAKHMVMKSGFTAELVEARRKLKEPKKKHTNTEKELNRINNAALKAGMSYGQYVAMMEKGSSYGKDEEILVLEC